MINTAKLKGRMVTLGIQNADTAKKLGMSPSTLSAKINNKRAMKIEEAESIQRILNIPDNEFASYFMVKKKKTVGN